MSWEARLFVESDTLSVLKALSDAFSPQKPLAIPPASRTEERGDLYITAAGLEAFGLKYRDMKKLELKCRTETHSATVGESDQIVVEKWQKQSVSTAIKCPKLDECNARLSDLAAEIASQVPVALTAALPNGGAVSVAKRRWTVFLALEPSNVQAVEVAELVLTFPSSQTRAPLRVVSLCVEAGEGKALCSDLLTINAALQKANLHAFIGGYPAFLAFQMKPKQAADDNDKNED
jgi:hypothetical protein